MQKDSDELDLKWEAEEGTLLQDTANWLNAGGYAKLKGAK